MPERALLRVRPQHQLRRDDESLGVAEAIGEEGRAEQTARPSCFKQTPRLCMGTHGGKSMSSGR
jgi:hypothetical protein